MNPNNPFERIQGNEDNTFNPFARNTSPNPNTFSQPMNTNIAQTGANYVSPFRPPFSGRFITSPDDIVVRDIPTDGSLALFPYMDCSTIIAKAWNANGKVVTVRYIADPSQFETQPAQNPSGTLENVIQRLEKIERALSAAYTESATTVNKEATTNG